MRSYLFLAASLLSFASSFCFAAEENPHQNSPYVPSLSQYAVEPDDLLGAKLTIGAFHLYSQWLENTDLDMSKAVKRDRTLAYVYPFTYEYPAHEDFADWQFKAFEGHLGFYGPHVLIGNESKEFFGAVGFHPTSNTIAVTFRGSQVIGEYFYNNLNCCVKLPLSQREGRSIRDLQGVEGYHDVSFNGPFHAGYYNRLMTCQESLLSHIRHFLSIAQTKPRLIITGHSLGAASSCMLAGLLVSDEVSIQELPMPKNKFWELKNHFSQISLIPFGAPRISTHDYGLWLKKRGVKIRNFTVETDIIPCVPTHQIVGSFSLSAGFPKYEDIDTRLELDCHNIPMCQILSAHDVRLYWRSLADKAGIDHTSFPVFKLSNDSQYMTNLLGLK